ncbi:protein mkt1 [Anaeramoeba flamelloides]|uniref:Protein mkt1 n=1 Tax=Anaeramoeba flamelloides TaxID=1746091 RepID=A0ABQ8YG12_9EUKA|nr:protein mkt1 [Anaeramoeba flamelloides]
MTKFIRNYTRNLISTESLESLKGKRVGIQGQYWITKIKINEPFQVATGGLPLTYKNITKKQIEQFKSYGITPVFVFGGLSTPKMNSGQAYIDRRLLDRSRGIIEAEKGQLQNASRNLKSSCTFYGFEGGYKFQLFITNLIEYLKELKVEVIRAPYLPEPQLTVFVDLENGFIDEVYAGQEYLLYNNKRVIINFDFNEGTFDVIKDFDFNQFYQENQNQNQNTQNWYALNKDGVVRSISFQNMREYVGFQLPQQIYFYLSQNIIGPRVLDSIISLCYFEPPPLFPSINYLDILNGELIKKYLIHSQSLLLRSLNDEFTTFTYHKIIWNNTQQQIPLDIFVVPQQNEMNQRGKKFPFCKSSQHLFKQFRDSEQNKLSENDKGKLFEQLSQPSDYISAVMKVDGKYKPLNIDLKKNRNLILFSLDTKQELLFHVHKNFLIATGYINPNYTLTSLGKPLQECILKFPQYSEMAMVFIQMLLNNSIFSDQFNYNENIFGVSLKELCTVEETEHSHQIRLISRIFSSFATKFKGDSPWSTIVYHDLLAFKGIVNLHHETLRNLFEMILLDLLLRGKSFMKLPSLSKCQFGYPCYVDESVSCGIVIRWFLEQVISGNSASEVYNNLDKQFDCFVDIYSDLKNAIQFWFDGIMGIVEYLYKAKNENEQIISEKLYQSFISANELLKSHTKNFFQKKN